MPRIRARKSGGVSITLPDHVAALLRVETGGYVDFEPVQGGVLLKPLTADERREAALADLHDIQSRVTPSPEMAALSPEEQEKAVARILAEDDDE